MANIILSIRPLYVDKILGSTKLVELRKQIPKDLKERDWVFMYSTSPVKAFAGAFKVQSIISSSPKTLWETTKTFAGVSAAEFFSYFGSNPVGFGLCFTEVVRFTNEVSLDQIKRINPSFTIPQSFRYADEAESRHFESLM